ncbi:hypothetical protein SAMN02745171_01012 [Porphyromonas circumdentaria]|uniref:Uncharacterized protein n=1 Tax=Porphyromonas circumdentaria TaxID=29524 RepID=A0A1T4N5X3_9PORP|nr:hypothetical protein [Porphyromonas circumdentaria]SJZ74622.1 hypothetical protein SAMN02745171_01012 [Porphyromonas circumdentaria]
MGYSVLNFLYSCGKVQKLPTKSRFAQEEISICRLQIYILRLNIYIFRLNIYICNLQIKNYS